MNKFDYFKTMREAAHFSLKYKVLWIFGFILALFSGSSGSSGSGGSSYDGETKLPEKVGERVNDLFENTEVWILIAIIAVVFVLISIIIWYLKRVALTAITRAYVFDKEGNESMIGFKTLWKEAQSYILKLLVFDLLWMLVMLPVVLLVIGAVALSIIVGSTGVIMTMIICLVCLLFPIIFILSLVVNLLKKVGERLIILRGYSAIEALQVSYATVKDNLKVFALAILASWLPGCGFLIITAVLGMIVIIPLLIFILPIAVSAIVESTAMMVLSLVGLMCGVLILSMIMAIVKAPYIVFIETYWSKFLDAVFENEKLDSSIQEAEIVD